MPTEENKKKLSLLTEQRVIHSTRAQFHIVLGVIDCKPVVDLMLMTCSSSPCALARFRMKAKTRYIA